MVGVGADIWCLRRSPNCTQCMKADKRFCTQAIQARADLVGDGHTEATILWAAVSHQERPKVVHQEG